MRSRFTDVSVHMERGTDPYDTRCGSLVIEDESKPKRWLLHLSSGEVLRLRDELNDIIDGEE